MLGRVRPGFTLLETAVALMVVGVASVGVLGAVAAALRTAGSARSAIVGESLAEERFATLQLLPAEELLPLPDSLRQGRFPPPLQSYAWEAAAARAFAEPGLVDVSVSVQSPDNRYTLEGLLYRRAPIGSVP